MIRVVVELHPGGSSRAKRQLATIDIIRVDHKDPHGPVGDYRVRSFGEVRGAGGSFGRAPLITGFDRSRGALALVWEALRALGFGEDR